MVQRSGLFRSRTNKIIGGVASGIAYSLNTDPTLIRIIFILLAVFWGGGVLLYLILWIALPEENIPFIMPGENAATAGSTAEPSAEPGAAEYVTPRPQTNAALIMGLILIAVGAAFLLERFIPAIRFAQFWPAILIVAGLVLIFSNITGIKKL